MENYRSSDGKFVKREKISLWDTGLYNPYWTFFKKIHMTNIETIGELIKYDGKVDELIGPYDYDTDFEEKIAKRELQALINIIKYIYYGIDIPEEMINLLNQPVIINDICGGVCIPSYGDLGNIGLPLYIQKNMGISTYFNNLSLEKIKEDAPYPIILGALTSITTMNDLGTNFDYASNDIFAFYFKIVTILKKAWNSYLDHHSEIKDSLDELYSEKQTIQPTIKESNTISDEDLKHINQLRILLNNMTLTRDTLNAQIALLNEEIKKLERQTNKKGKKL